MHLIFILVQLLWFCVSVSAMPRLKKGVGRMKKTNASFKRDDSRPIVRPREPLRKDNEDGAPESRKRKAARSISVDSDRDENWETTVGAVGRRLAIAVYFIDILDVPHESEWDEQDETVAIIHRKKNNETWLACYHS